jgi:hypothetical protein
MALNVETPAKMTNCVDLSGYVILLVEADNGGIKLYGKQVIYILLVRGCKEKIVPFPNNGSRPAWAVPLSYGLRCLFL